MSTQGDVKTRTKKKVQRPKRYRVILFNDDYTSMEFVVAILVSVFHMAAEKAVATMLKVHEEGSGTAGVYPYEVADEKVRTVHERARSAGYPLRAGMEEE